MNPKEYDGMEKYLQEINTSIVNNDTEHFKSFNEFLEFFRKDLETTDYIFKHHRGVQCTGSYLHKNFIGSPDEFDMNLTIKLPINYKEVAVEINNAWPGFVKINMKAQADILKKSQISNNFKSILKWINDEGYVIQNKFHQWMEGVVEKSLSNLRKDGQIIFNSGTSSYSIISSRFQKSGPAFTLKVQKLNSDIQFSIDLVPVLIFSSDLPHVNLKAYKKKEWYAVAKPFYQDIGSEKDKLWRLSFPLQEDEIWTGQNFMKPTCRLLKQIRDNESMPYIASYYINTVLLTMNRDNPEIFKGKKSLSYIFMTALNLFFKMIGNENIPYFWIKNHNLLSHLKADQINDCKIKLNIVIKKIEKNYAQNPSFIKEVILPQNKEEALVEQVLNELGVGNTVENRANERNTYCVVM